MHKSIITYICPLIFIACTLSLVNCSSSGKDDTAMSLGDLFPSISGNYESSGEFEIYDYNGIFTYIDGAGEVYRMYDYREVWVRHYTFADDPRITVEVFDMGKSEDAYGIFIHSWQETKGIGQGYSLSGDILCFWQDRYLVNVYAEKTTPVTKLAIRDLADKISAEIKVTGPRPEIVNYLPSDGMTSGSLRFFHLHTSLNYHYYLSPDNILQLDNQTDIALAQYGDDDTYLVCIHYPDNAKAESARLSFLENYIPEAGESGSLEIQENQWVIVERYNEFLIIVFDAPTLETGTDLLSKCWKKLPI